MKKGNKKWYKKWTNWLMVVVCTVLVGILTVNVSIMIQANTDKDKVPSVFGYKPFIVLSGSMETEIKVGDLIITKIVDPTTLKVDDVIAFRDNEGTVTTHRIIEIVNREGVDYFITKGDNNTSQDQNLVELSDVEGIYVTRIPSIGNILNGLANPTTIIIVILGITVVFAAAFMVSNKKQIDQEKLEFLEYKRQKELEEKQKNEIKEEKTTEDKESKEKKAKNTKKKN